MRANIISRDLLVVGDQGFLLAYTGYMIYFPSRHLLYMGNRKCGGRHFCTRVQRVAACVLLCCGMCVDDDDGRDGAMLI